MKFNLTILLFLNLVLSHLNLQGQNSNRDTIYIYETIEVYDTIYIYEPEDPIRYSDLANINGNGINYLQYDSTSNHAQLIIISDSLTATIPLDGIILNEHPKQLESMKKMSFLSVMLFAANTLLFAQTDYGVTVGTGTWWQSSTREFVEKPPLAPLFSIGLFLNQPIINKNFSLKLEANYAFLISRGKYVYGKEGSGYLQRFYEYNDGLHYASTSFIDANERYGNNLHNLTIPISIKWQKHKIQPYLGINYYLLGYNTPNYNPAQGLGLQGGLEFKINKQFKIDCNYLLKGYDYGEGGASIAGDQILLSEHVSMRNNQIRLSLNYTFKKKVKYEQVEEIVVPSYGKPRP